MTIALHEVPCKSALTGSGGHYRLNPYVGCEHACAYCYATYIARWRGESGPWGTWVQAKTNIPRVLERELRRKRGIEVMLSTVCDVYQPVEAQCELTRRCLSVLALAAREDPCLRVFVLTKSDLILRDLDVLSAFPEGQLRIGFSISTPRDTVAKLVEPGAPPPSRRFTAAERLSAEGLRVGVFISPVLPYVTERDLPALLDLASSAGCQSVSFDMLNYLDRHIGGKMRQAYTCLGREALVRLEQARRDPAYEPQVRERVARLIGDWKPRSTATMTTPSAGRISCES